MTDSELLVTGRRVVRYGTALLAELALAKTNIPEVR